MSTRASLDPSAEDARLTRQLLTCGMIAGPFFVLLGLIQAFTIPGFDLTRHYLSQLSSGPLGWIQIVNFVIAGVLAVAAAIGMRRALRSGSARSVGPLLLAGFGIGFAAAGVFVADPANSFPPGAPEGMPTTMSWHSMAHGIAAILSFLFLFGSCLAFAYRFARRKEWGWSGFSFVTGLVTFGLPSIPNPYGGVFLFVASAIGWVWIWALSARLRQGQPT